MSCLAIIGTRAQAIKMAPVVYAIRHQGLECRIALTGQHEQTVDGLLSEFGLQADIRLSPGTEITTIAGGLRWLLKVLPRAVAACRQSKATPRPQLILVHGDTVSTLIGAVAGRLAGCRVAHVEAGLRSGSLLDPFPEELIRRLVTRISHVAYCPGEAPLRVCLERGVECVNTVENTILDSLRQVLGYDSRLPEQEVDYVVISAHRMETVMRDSRLRQLHDLTLRIAERLEVRFVLHPVTQKRLSENGLLEQLQAHPNVQLLPRMGYGEFIHLAASARAILTDGGGNQEEMSYLGIKTLVLRQHTERDHGLGVTTHVTGLDTGKVIDALDREGSRSHGELGLAEFDSVHPSRTIASDVVERLSTGRS